MNCDSASWIFTSLPNSVGFTFFPITNGLRVSFEHTEHLVGMMGVALQHPGARLLQHAPGQRAHVLHLRAQSLHLLTPAAWPAAALAAPPGRPGAPRRAWSPSIGG